MSSNKTGGDGRIPISELSIYDSGETKLLEYTVPRRTALEERIGVVRQRVWTVKQRYDEYFESVRERYERAKQKTIEYKNVVTEMGDADVNIVPKVAAVSLIGIIGFAAAGRSRVRQFFFPVIGSTAMAAVCFPGVTKEVAVKPGLKVYHQIVEQLGDLKTKGLQRITQKNPITEDTVNREMIKVATSEVSEELESSVIQESKPEGESKDIIMGVSDSMKNEVQRIDEDIGQSDLSDSDMYTAHSRK
jgi:hypothetical protein